MVYLQRITKTELARNTHRAIREAQRGYAVVVENHGQAEVAIVDILDFRLQRAAIQYFAAPAKYDEDIKITEELLESLPDEQDRCNLVIGHYLAMDVSLARAAEFLGMHSAELQMRLARAGVPLHLGPRTLDEARSEIETARRFEKKGR
jgi:predicted HTH domain antitoxin